jgi:hypothetical protein
MSGESGERKVTRNVLSWRDNIRIRWRIHACIESRTANLLTDGRI